MEDIGYVLKINQHELKKKKAYRAVLIKKVYLIHFLKFKIKMKSQAPEKKEMKNSRNVQLIFTQLHILYMCIL